MFKLLYQNPMAWDKYQRHFRYIMVDEFQDTNYLQYEIQTAELVMKKSEKHLHCRRWRSEYLFFSGATIENILQYEHDFKDVKTLSLNRITGQLPL